VQTIDWTIVLDREQLQLVTLDDVQLMREILGALIDDTSRQIGLMDIAIRNGDPRRCARLAHSSTGACSNCGANAAASVLRQIEHSAATADLAGCRDSLAALSNEVERLRSAAAEV
jgi:HPt (histidine-containing phosphotransfer) domain-containing protein